MANSTITAAKGFLSAGIACGLKKSGKPDLGLISCPAGAKTAAVFTTNKIVSAAVTVSKAHAKSASIYGVVVNSGNANACTGKQGLKNAITMCSATAKKLSVDPHSRNTQDILEPEFERSKGIVNPLIETIKSTDNLIDQIVYKLYGLTDEEIKIVEESLT